MTVSDLRGRIDNRMKVFEAFRGYQKYNMLDSIVDFAYGALCRYQSYFSHRNVLSTKAFVEEREKYLRLAGYHSVEDYYQNLWDNLQPSLYNKNHQIVKTRNVGKTTDRILRSLDILKESNEIDVSILPSFELDEIPGVLIERLTSIEELRQAYGCK